MNKARVQGNCTDVADNIEMMMEALCERGFSRAEAVQMITGMLSSSVVYTPFAGVVSEEHGTTH